MSDRMTGIRTRDSLGGFAVYGRVSRQEMIAKYRAELGRELRRTQELLAKSDDEFIVETFLGIHARRNVEEVR